MKFAKKDTSCCKRNKKSLKQRFYQTVNKHKFTARLAGDFTYRTMMISSVSLAFNVLLSLSKFIAGWFYSSTWLMVLAGYYLILCISRVLLLHYGRAQATLVDKTEVVIHEWKAYRLCGIMLLVMMTFLQGVVIMIVKNGTGFSYHEIVVIAIATYDFLCLGNGIFYMIRKRKNHSPIINSLKMISLASSFVAILSLQTAMFSAFSGEEEAMLQIVLNILTGSGVCIVLIVLGITSIVKANRELKERRKHILRP